MFSGDKAPGRYRSVPATRTLLSQQDEGPMNIVAPDALSPKNALGSTEILVVGLVLLS